MSRSDINKLITVAVMLGLIVVIFGLNTITKFINPLYLGIFALVLEYVIIAPGVVKRYYKLFGSNAGVWRFIPVVNECQIMTPAFCIATLILFAVGALLIGASFLPMEVFAKFTSGDIAQRAYQILFGGMGCLTVASFVSGFGLWNAFSTISTQVRKGTGVKTPVRNFIYLVCLLFPISRAIGILEIGELCRMAQINDYGSEDDTNMRYLEEE